MICLARLLLQHRSVGTVRQRCRTPDPTRSGTVCGPQKGEAECSSHGTEPPRRPQQCLYGLFEREPLRIKPPSTGSAPGDWCAGPFTTCKLDNMSDMTYPRSWSTHMDKPLAWLHGEVKTPAMTNEARIQLGYLPRLLQRGGSFGMPRSRPMPSIGARRHELRVREAPRR